MLFSIASVFPDVSNWPCFHPLHCLPPTFPLFLSNGASYDTDSPVRTDSGLLILFWTDFSLGLLHAQLGSLDSLSSGLMFLIPGSHVYLSLRYPLLFCIIIQTHHPFFFPATHSQVAFWKVWWRVKAAVNMGWGVGVVGLSPALLSASLSSCSLSRALPSRPFFSPVNILPVSLPLLRSLPSYHFSIQWVFRHLLKPLVSCCPRACFY